MSLSKKEWSIAIEIVYSIAIALVFLPFFVRNQATSFERADLIGTLTEITVFSVLYFSIAYAVLELTHRNKITDDERCDMIHSKAYKLGYILYEIALLIFIGSLIRPAQVALQNGGVICVVLSLLIAISTIKSVYQLYLHRTL